MPCYRPVACWPKVGGGITSSHKDRDFFRSDVIIPCRKCVGCVLEKRRDQAVRCMCEKQLHEQACFVTLTHADETLPADCSVSKDMLREFMRRARYHFGLSAEELPYYGCGEYGSENWRPHYHALIFGADFAEDRKIVRDEGGKKAFTSATLENLWPYGTSELADVTLASAQYVAGYTSKKAEKLAAIVKAKDENGDTKEYYSRHHILTGEPMLINPEFVASTKNPAIGRRWLERFQSDVFPSGTVVVAGTSYSAPSYFLRRLEETFKAEALDGLGLADLLEASSNAKNIPAWKALLRDIEERKVNLLHAHDEARTFFALKAERVAHQKRDMALHPEQYLPLRMEQREEHAYLTRFKKLERNL